MEVLPREGGVSDAFQNGEKRNFKTSSQLLLCYSVWQVVNGRNFFILSLSWRTRWLPFAAAGLSVGKIQKKKKN